MPNPEVIAAGAIVVLLLLALTGRALTSLLLCAYLFTVVVISSAIKQHYLGLPLTLSDQLFFFLAPLQNFKLFLNYPVLGLTLLAILVLSAALLVLGLRVEPVPAWLRRAWPGGLLRALAALSVVAIASGHLMPDARAHHVGDSDAYAAYLTLQDMRGAHGFVQRLNVYFDNREVLATLPAPRQQHRFPFAEAGAAAADPRVVATLPDILMVLEESTFDPALIARCRLAPCHSVLFQAPALTRSEQGPLLVHTTGGGTWLSEFAFLSGFDWRIFGRGGAFAPVSLAPRLERALPRYLHSLGYRTVAIYPVDGDFLSARQAYQGYGFDEFYAAEELQLQGDWHTVHDGTVFAKTLDFAERHSDARPLFVFVLTIRNHGPHGASAHDLARPYAQAVQQLGGGLGDYLSRLNDSGVEFAGLRQRWLGAARPRVIGWFGDHQPEMAWDYIDAPGDLDHSRLATNAGREQFKYLTYFQISANFGTREVIRHPAALDLAYLGERVLSFAGVPLDADYRAAAQADAACGGLLVGCGDRELVEDYLDYRIYGLRAIQ